MFGISGWVELPIAKRCTDSNWLCSLDRQTMCAAGHWGDVIILSDDDDVVCSGPVVDSVKVEEEKEEEEEEAEKKNDTPMGVAEDVVVTFSRRPELLPHARYDCPLHPFTATDGAVQGPVAENHVFCEQCFCFICDKLASACEAWCHDGACHCNSHRKSIDWKTLRDSVLLGGLQTFKLEVSDIDSHLKHAEKMLQDFKEGLCRKLVSFQKGKPLAEYGLNLPKEQALVHDYTPVYEHMSSFLDEADKQEEKAAAIMRLGATQEFLRHFHGSGGFVLVSPVADVGRAKGMLLQRVIASLQRQMVMADFKPEFRKKLQDFFLMYCVPVELKKLKNSLCIRSWTDALLVSVLRGQNVSGFQKKKGKRDVLFEPIAAVLLRTEVLQQQLRYRELCRYLWVVQSDEPKLLEQVRDLIPFFLCMDGDFRSAVVNMLLAVNAPITRLTPHLFLFYLCVLRKAKAPLLVVTQPAQLCDANVEWHAIKGAVPLMREALVKFAISVQRCCPAIFNDAECWISLLTIVNTPLSSQVPLTSPSAGFLHDAKSIVHAVLMDDKVRSKVCIPRYFQDSYPEQSLLLVVTGALGLRVLHSPLHPILPVFNTFKDNMWTLEWFWDFLACGSGRLSSFFQEVMEELKKSPDQCSVFPVLRSLLQSQCHQQPSNC